MNAYCFIQFPLTMYFIFFFIYKMENWSKIIWIFSRVWRHLFFFLLYFALFNVAISIANVDLLILFIIFHREGQIAMKETGFVLMEILKCCHCNHDCNSSSVVFYLILQPIKFKDPHPNDMACS